MSTVTRYTDRYVSYAGDGYDGVGQVVTASSLGTGTLLANGRAVLTAAHVVENNYDTIRVAFDGIDGRHWATVADYWIHSGYSTAGYRDDVALLWLDEMAPLSIPRYELYRTSDELGQVATLVGYGATGLGSRGHDGGAGQQRSIVQNTLETTWTSVNAALSGNGWYTPPGSQLVADFDSGNSRYDTLGNLLGLYNTGLGDNEGLIAPGDSGGPAFVDGKLAGVASYSASLRGSDGQRLDSTYKIDSSFGELGAWQRVSHYQDWIDDRLAEVGSSLRLIDDLVRVGGGGRELMLGNRGNDVLRAGGGNDRLFGGAGNDRLEGGSGVDVARFAVGYDQATLTRNANGDLVVISNSTEADTLTGVELLRFNDRIVLAEAPVLAVSDGFDEAFYLADNPDVSEAVERGVIVSGEWHYQHYGAAEGRAGNASVSGFDVAFYLAQNPDVAAAVATGSIGVLTHYRDYGAREGRDPNALFDESWYRAENPDVAVAVERGDLDSAYEHYLAYGWKESRDPSAWMDLDAYRSAHPDVAAAGIDPLGHYLAWGAMEGRVVVANDGDLWS